MNLMARFWFKSTTRRTYCTL